MPVPGTHNDWTIYQGSKFAETVKWPGISDATGYSARMHIRSGDYQAAPLILALTIANSRIALSSSDGYLNIALTISAIDTALLDYETGYYDIKIVPPSGEADAWRALQGTIAIDRQDTP